MIFLLLNMFVYLVLAAAIGGAAGWFWRNLQAQQTDEAALRQVNDAKSKVPQLESFLRARDEQLAKTQEKLNQYQEIADQQRDELEALRKDIQKGEAELRRTQALLKNAQTAQETLESADFLEADDIQNDIQVDTEAMQALQLRYDEAQQEIDQARQEIVSLQNKVEAHEAQAAQPDPELLAQLDKLRVELAASNDSLARADQALVFEREKVADLEREQNLHNKSLQVLHQQLEMERKRRIAAG